MRYDVKSEILQVIQDNSLSKQEKIQKIKDIYYSSQSGGITGADTKSVNSDGNSSSSNGNSDQSDSNGQAEKNNGQNQSNGGNKQGNGQSNQKQEQGQNSQQSGNNGVHNVSHNQLKNQGVGGNNQQNGGQQNGNSAQGNQGNKSGQQGQNLQNGVQSGQQGLNGNQQGSQQSGQGGSQTQSQSQSQQGQGSQQQGQSGNQNGQGGSQSQSQQGQGSQQQNQNSQQNGQGSSQSQSQSQSHQGQNGQSGSQGQSQGQNGQQTQQQAPQERDSQFDEYTIGYILGKKYAEEMYAHGGLKPIMGDMIDLPKKLTPMKILESLNESIDDDISSLLDDLSIDDDARVNKIHDLFRDISDPGDNNQQDQNKKEIYVPDDVILMRNGSVNLDDDDAIVGDHVIDKNIGDEIRKEVGITPKDPDWGMSDDEESMIKEAFPIIEDIFKHAPQDDKEILSSAKEMESKIKGRIRKSREGIINWKEALQKFISQKSRIYTKGPIRKNVYTRTGIGVRHRVRTYTNYNKCVVYIDTSGSVNNSQTQLIPIMAGEIGKIVNDCHFNTVDIHLFNSKVYDEHFDVDSNVVKDENWGIEGASDGGDTNIHAVYRHIADKYIDENGILKYDIDAIIIITDVSGMEYGGGNIKPFLSIFDRYTLERMLYVIYNDYSNKFLKEVTESMDKLISEYSQHYEISVEAFKKQILNESMNIKKRIINMNEALGGLGSIKRKREEGKNDSSQRSDEEKSERLRKANIQGARALGRLAEILPELVANLKKFFQNCEMVKEYTAVTASANTYYVTEDAHVIVHANFDNKNIDSLCEACSVMIIDRIIGNIVLAHDRTFTGFPVGFPKEIDGDLKLLDLPRFTNFNNAPQAITGKVSINIYSRALRNSQNEYIKSLKNTLMSIDDEIENKPKSVFTMTMRKDESVSEIINNRIALSESYINEMALPKKLSTVFPRRSKPQSGSKFTNNDYIASTELYKKNRNVFFDVINPILNVGWGDISDKDVTVIDNVSEIRKAAKDSKYFEKNKDNIDQLGYAGIRIFTTSDNIISAVYAQPDKNKKSKIVYLNDENGNPITDVKEINDEINNRFEVFKQTYKYLNSVGVKPENMPDKLYGRKDKGKNSTVEGAALHILYFLMSMLNGTSGAVDYTFKPYSILYDAFTGDGIHGKYNNGEMFSTLFSYIFPNARMIDDYSAVVQTDNGRFRVNFDQTKDRQPGKKGNFNDAYFNSNSGHSVFECFSDNFLKAMLIGSSLRGVDNDPRYKIDEIINADRDDLLSMIESVKNVELIKTSLMTLSYKGKDKDGNYDHSNPFDVLMMFPDKCEIEYDIRVDVNDEALNLVRKKVTRDIYKSGMYNDIKDYRYDRATGTRTRSDIKGTSSLKSMLSRKNNSGVFDSFDSTVKYIVDNKDIFDDAKIAIQDAIDAYTYENSSYSNDDLLDKFSRSVDDIVNYSNLIKLKVINDPEILDNKSDVIDVMLDSMTNLIYFIEDILSPEDKENYKSIIDSGDALVNETKKFSELYAMLIGKDKSALYTNSRGNRTTYQDIVSRKVDKLGRKKSKVLQNKTNTGSQNSDRVKSDYAKVVNDLSGCITDVNNIVKGIDFAGASFDAVDYFETKDSMIRRISNKLDGVISVANKINSEGSVDWMNSTLPLLNEVLNICESIMYSDDEETITDFLVDLDVACRKISKSTRRLLSNGNYTYSGSTVA